jgi:hypothetical protein
MKLKIKSMVVVASAAVISTVHAQNLLQNGSFEDPLVGATLQNAAPTSWTADMFNYLIGNGASSDYLPATDGTQIDDPLSSIHQDISLVAGQQYALTFDLSSLQLPGHGANLAVEIFSSDEADQINRTFTVPINTAAWQQQTLTFTAAETSTYTLAIFDNGAQNGVDNMNLQAVPEPGSIALLGLGGVFPFFRRKRA